MRYSRRLYKLKLMFRYIKGRVWCMTFHQPVVRCMGGYGGRTVFGRRQRAYHGMWCVKCNNRWDQESRGEKCIGSHIWHTRKHEKHAMKEATNG